jgi:hypothetical protein
MEIYKLILLLPFCDDINNIIKNIWFRTFIPVTCVNKDAIILMDNHLLVVVAHQDMDNLIIILVMIFLQV